MKQYGVRFGCSGGYPLALGAVDEEGFYFTPISEAPEETGLQKGAWDSFADSFSSVTSGLTNVVNTVAPPATQAYQTYKSIQQPGQPPVLPGPPMVAKQSSNTLLWGVLAGVLVLSYVATR